MEHFLLLMRLLDLTTLRLPILPITTIGQQIDVIAKTAMDLLVQQMEEQKKRVPKPLGEPVHKQIAPVLIRRNTTK